MAAQYRVSGSASSARRDQARDHLRGEQRQRAGQVADPGERPVVERRPERGQRRVTADLGQRFGGALTQPFGLIVEQRGERRDDLVVAEFAEADHRLFAGHPLGMVEQRQQSGYGRAEAECHAAHRGPGLAVVAGVDERGKQWIGQRLVDEDVGLVQRPGVEGGVVVGVVADEGTQGVLRGLVAVLARAVEQEVEAVLPVFDQALLEGTQLSSRVHRATVVPGKVGSARCPGYPEIVLVGLADNVYVATNGRGISYGDLD